MPINGSLLKYSWLVRDTTGLGQYLLNKQCQQV